MTSKQWQIRLGASSHDQDSPPFAEAVMMKPFDLASDVMAYDGIIEKRKSRWTP